MNGVLREEWIGVSFDSSRTPPFQTADRKKDKSVNVQRLKIANEPRSFQQGLEGPLEMILSSLCCSDISAPLTELGNSCISIQ